MSPCGNAKKPTPDFRHGRTAKRRISHRKIMPHTLITGITGSGKTHMMRHIANHIPRRTRLVYDPTGSLALEHSPHGENPCIVCDDEEKFIDCLYLPELKNADIFCDEADIIFPQATPHRWILQRGRHFGLRVFVASQRPALLDTTCRYQCGRAFVFRGNPSDYVAVLPIYGLAGMEKKVNIPMHSYMLLYPSENTAELMRIHPPVGGRGRGVDTGEKI